MKLYGMEKLSLVDFDAHTAATVFTGGCNFFCPYCHNGGLVVLDRNAPYIEESEVLAYLEKRSKLLDGLVITGGEPTLHSDLPDFCRRVKDKGYEIKLDSNGTNPSMLFRLIDDKLVDYIAMDIKNSPAKYPLTCGERVDERMLERVRESVKLLLNGKVGYEFRTTAVKELHERQDFEAIGEWIAGADRYFLQRFRASDGCLSKDFTEISPLDASEFLKIVAPHVKYASLRNY